MSQHRTDEALSALRTRRQQPPTTQVVSLGTECASAATVDVMVDRSDRRAMRLIRRGDPAGLSMLYQRHAALLDLRLRRAGASESEVEDLLQETFLAVWHGAASFREEGPVAAWLWGIAHNKLRSQIRTATRRRDRESRAAAPAAIDDTDWAETIHVEGQLAALRPDMREAIQAVAIEGLSVAEAALRLGVPEGTIKSRVSRARAILRQEQP